MIHPDNSEAAIEIMRTRAQHLIDGGMDMEEALGESIKTWERSLLRAQMLRRFEDDLRRRGKPTLHVSLFEAAKIR